jgi:hypothetical protein
MQPKPTRLVELDFFRGLVLLVILVDHIGGSILSRITLHAFAFNDAAEVFVFLGGFATATAYASIATRRSESAARARFIKRAFEVYRAFLVTAILMLMTSFVLRPFFGAAPNLAIDDLESFLAEPLTVIGDVMLARRQPYLSSVLPMYAIFALAVPCILPLARSKPWTLLAASTALWCVAPPLGDFMPSATDTLWDFNPVAWQLMFVLGVIAQCQPVYRRVSGHRYGWTVSAMAAISLAGLAVYKLGVLAPVVDPDFKSDLAALRVVNFLAFAWLAADLARLGHVKWIARHLPLIGDVGRDGLACFIAGAVISLTVDSMLYTVTDGMLDLRLGFAADLIALSMLLMVPHRKAFVAACRARWESGRKRTA